MCIFGIAPAHFYNSTESVLFVDFGLFSFSSLYNPETLIKMTPFRNITQEFSLKIKIIAFIQKQIQKANYSNFKTTQNQ